MNVITEVIDPEGAYFSLIVKSINTKPKAFFVYSGGAILDEVQRCPQLLSHLQVAVDENPQPGRFILTSSQ